MTDTAKVADVILPATMFVEHDDFYTAGGSQYILLGPKLIEPPGECRSNHDVICALAQRLGADASGLRDDAARTDRRHAAKIRLGHARRARGQPLDRLPAGFRHRALSRRLRLSGRQIPLQAGLARGAVPALAPRLTTVRPFRHCPTIGTSSRRRTPSIRSASPLRRRAAFSIRPSPKRRPRLPASGARK